MANPYEIAIHISMTNAVSPVLAMIAKDMLGLQMSAKKLEDAMGRMGANFKVMIAGAVTAFAGYEIGQGILDIADKGEKLLHQKNMLIRAGLQENQILALTAKAYADITRDVPTATAADALRATNELRSVLGDANKAAAWAPLSLKAEALLSNATQKDAEGEGFKLWRALEMKGITASNPALTQKLMDALVQDIIGSGGKLDGSTYQQWAKRGGASWIHASPQFIAGPGSVAAADLGGDGAGTAMMTLYNLLTGATVLSKQQYQVLKDAGLIDPKKVTFNKNHTINAQPGAIAGSLQYADDLYGWAQFIKGPLEKLAKGDPKVFDSLLAKLGRNRNAIKMLTMFTDPGFGDQIAKDVANWSQAMRVDDAYDAMMGRVSRPMSPTEAADMAGPGNADRQKSSAQRMADYTAVMKAFQTQWESMMMAIGGPVAQGLIPVLQGLTNEFNHWGAMANKYPGAVKAIAEITGALAAAMITLGTGAVLVGAFTIMGPVAAGVAAIAAIVATLAALNWRAVADGFKAIYTAISSFIDYIGELLNKLDAMFPKNARVKNNLPPSKADHSLFWFQERNDAQSALWQAGYRGNDLASEMARESKRGAYTAPPVTVDTKVEIVVSGDLKGLINAVVSKVENAYRTVNGPSGFDGRASWAPPDMP